MPVEQFLEHVQIHIAPHYEVWPIDIGQDDKRTWITADLILNGTDGRVTVLCIDTHEPGLLMIDVSDLHGDEGDGGAANLQTALLCRDKLINGALISVLNANPWAARAQQRIAPDAGMNQNMNALFGIETAKTPLEKHASTLFNLIVTAIEDNPEKGVVIDFHSEGRSDRSIPYIRIDRTDNDELQELLLCLGLVSGLPLVMEYANLKGEGLEHALSTSLVRQGIPALTIEVGSGADLNSENIDLATSAAERIGAYLKMLPDKGLPEIKLPGLHQLANIYACHANGDPIVRNGTLYLPEKFIQPGTVLQFTKGGPGKKNVGHLTPITLNDKDRLQLVFPRLDITSERDIEATVISMIPKYQQFDPTNPLCTAAIPETDPRLLDIYKKALVKVFGTVL